MMYKSFGMDGYIMNKLFVFLIALLILGIGGYSGWNIFTSSHKSEIRISINPWVGFTPFIYAQEKGWLEGTPFTFLWVVDLSENARLFDKGFAEGFTATQYELLHFKHPEELTTAFLIDQSDGADAILSNRTLEQLHNSNVKINVYLEMGSLNQDLFNAFVREYKMDKNTFRLVDSSQKSMDIIDYANDPLIVITYEPYLSQMRAKGLQVIASTRTLKSFHAIDALFTKKSSLQDQADDYKRLKDVFERAKAQLQENPKEFYDTVKGYLEGTSYEDFIASTHQIKWISHGIHPQMVETLNKQNISTEKIIR